MDRSSEIIGELQSLVNCGLVPGPVLDLIKESKWKICNKMLDDIHKKNLLVWEECNHLIQLISHTVYWLDFFDPDSDRVTIN